MATWQQCQSCATWIKRRFPCHYPSSGPCIPYILSPLDGRAAPVANLCINTPLTKTATATDVSNAAYVVFKFIQWLLCRTQRAWNSYSGKCPLVDRVLFGLSMCFPSRGPVRTCRSHLNQKLVLQKRVFYDFAQKGK